MAARSASTPRRYLPQKSSSQLALTPSWAASRFGLSPGAIRVLCACRWCCTSPPSACCCGKSSPIETFSCALACRTRAAATCSERLLRYAVSIRLLSVASLKTCHQFAVSGSVGAAAGSSIQRGATGAVGRTKSGPTLQAARLSAPQASRMIPHAPFCDPKGSADMLEDAVALQLIVKRFGPDALCRGRCTHLSLLE